MVRVLLEKVKVTSIKKMKEIKKKLDTNFIKSYIDTGLSETRYVDIFSFGVYGTKSGQGESRKRRG